MSTNKDLPRLSVMLLDDHEVMRCGLGGLLREQGKIDVIGSFGTSQELNNALSKQPLPDVLLVDFALKQEDVDGLNMLRALKTHFPTSRVLVMSAHYDAPTVALAMKAGADGFMSKQEGLDTLLMALRAVAAGRTYLHPDMALLVKPRMKKLSNRIGESKLLDDVKLSPREGEVLRCFLAGLTVKEIAKKFSRSVATISSQKMSAYRKLGVRTDNELFKLRRHLS